MSTGIGYGKTILFGEHFVVYGLDAIAAGFDKKTVATITDSDEFEFIDDRPQTPGYKDKKIDEIDRQISSLRLFFSLDERNPVRITLSGDLVCASGVGSSAALAASISHALNEHFYLGLTIEEVNNAAYLAEEAGSGKPSGIDNTCSVYGGFILFAKNLEGGPNKIETITVDEPIDIVMANSGITQTTKEVVEDVRRQYDTDSVRVQKIFDEYSKVVKEGLDAIRSGDYTHLGELMNKNQELLGELDLSCKEIQEIIDVVNSSGGLGVKLTGTGGGGSVIALTPGEQLQNKVAKAVEDIGYH